MTIDKHVISPLWQHVIAASMCEDHLKEEASAQQITNDSKISLLDYP